MRAEELKGALPRILGRNPVIDFEALVIKESVLRIRVYAGFETPIDSYP
jgi:hypothetical protein